MQSFKRCVRDALKRPPPLKPPLECFQKKLPIIVDCTFLQMLMFQRLRELLKKGLIFYTSKFCQIKPSVDFYLIIWKRLTKLFTNKSGPEDYCNWIIHKIFKSLQFTFPRFAQVHYFNSSSPPWNEPISEVKIISRFNKITSVLLFGNVYHPRNYFFYFENEN